MTNEGCLLVVVIDVHPQLAHQERVAQNYLSACMSFANFHLSTSVKNRLAVLAANHMETRFLYPQLTGQKVDRQRDGRLELLDNLDESIMDELRSMLDVEAEVEQTESLISGAIGRALLYIKKHEREDAVGNKIHARILVIKISSDTGGQYLNYINTYLTAQKMNTAIDVCVIGNNCGLLQQGADISGGYYHCMQDVSQLLQTLILMYQPDVSIRKRLNAPPPDSVDYRAACFCHRTLIDMGNVCSNCLSVYCKAVPLCPTCNVIFQIDRPLIKLPKKKK